MSAPLASPAPLITQATQYHKQTVSLCKEYDLLFLRFTAEKARGDGIADGAKVGVTPDGLKPLRVRARSGSPRAAAAPAAA